MTSVRDRMKGGTMAPMGATVEPRGPLLPVPGWLPGRRVALAMIAYGIAGIALAVGSIVVLAGPAGRLQAMAGQQADAVHSLDLADRALVDAGAASSGAATSLAAAESSARSAAGLFRELQSAMVGLREASNLSILGVQPLSGLAGEFGAVADRSGALADDVGALAATLASERANLNQLSGDVASLRAELSGVRQLVGDAGAADLQDVFRGLAAMGILIAIWLTLPALASLAAGLAILRRLPPRGVGESPDPAGPGGGPAVAGPSSPARGGPGQ
jgi:hypothetical protein